MREREREREKKERERENERKEKMKETNKKKEINVRACMRNSRTPSQCIGLPNARNFVIVKHVFQLSRRYVYGVRNMLLLNCLQEQF